jgi:ubiquinone/menaquinone biosynthesis C-methylase UbiE
LEAASQARKRYLNNKICLETMDIEMAVKVLSGFDLVIFGFDTDKLGNENESLSKVSKCCKEGGFILVESSHNNIEEFEKVVLKSDLQIIDKVIHPAIEIKKMNSINTNKIQKRIRELKIALPEHKQLFEDYLNAQVDECSEIENNFITATYLLQTK